MIISPLATGEGITQDELITETDPAEDNQLPAGKAAGVPVPVPVPEHGGSNLRDDGGL